MSDTRNILPPGLQAETLAVRAGIDRSHHGDEKTHEKSMRTPLLGHGNVLLDDSFGRCGRQAVMGRNVGLPPRRVQTILMAPPRAHAHREIPPPAQTAAARPLTRVHSASWPPAKLPSRRPLARWSQ